MKKTIEFEAKIWYNHFVKGTDVPISLNEER